MMGTENDSEVLLVSNQAVGDGSASEILDAASGDEEGQDESAADGDIVDMLATTNTNADHVALSGPIANLCSATLGAGVLSIPYSLYQSGIVVGLALMFFSAAATILSIDMIVDAARKFSAATYEELVDKALGTRSRRIAELSILLFCEGVCVAYIIAVGDILGMLVGEQYKTTAMVAIWSITMLPLSLLRTMESLQWASSIGIFSICLLVVAALQHAIQNYDHTNTSQHLSSLLWPAHGLTSVLKALPMILFAFSCQVNVCAIHDELTTKSVMKWVTRGAVGICSALYLSIASVCLLDFGATIKGNVLLNYDIRNSSTLVHAAFASMATAVVMAFPINVFPSRSAVEGRWNMSLAETITVDNGGSRQPLLGNTIVDSGSTSNNDDVSGEEDVLQNASFGSSGDAALDNSLFGLMRHAVVTVLIAGSALALALVVPNISLVFGIIGGSLSSLLGFILPGALGIVSGDKYVGWIMVVCGTVIGLVTTAVTILTI
jgi:amino acid permease